MLTSLLIFQSCLYYYLTKKPIILSVLVRFYQKKILSQISKKITLDFLNSNFMLIHLALNALMPYGGRITISTSRHLVAQVTCLLSKHIEYLRLTKH